MVITPLGFKALPNGNTFLIIEAFQGSVKKIVTQEIKVFPNHRTQIVWDSQWDTFEQASNFLELYEGKETAEEAVKQYREKYVL